MVLKLISNCFAQVIFREITWRLENILWAISVKVEEHEWRWFSVHQCHLVLGFVLEF